MKNKIEKLIAEYENKISIQETKIRDFNKRLGELRKLARDNDNYTQVNHIEIDIDELRTERNIEIAKKDSYIQMREDLKSLLD